MSAARIRQTIGDPVIRFPSKRVDSSIDLRDHGSLAVFRASYGAPFIPLFPDLSRFEGIIGLWLVRDGNVAVRNARNLVRGVVVRGDKFVGRIHGVWSKHGAYVRGRATVDSRGYKGLGRIKYYGRKNSRYLLRWLGFYEGKPRRGNDKRPKAEWAVKFKKAHTRAVPVSMLKSSRVYLTENLETVMLRHNPKDHSKIDESSKNIVKVRAGQRVGIRWWNHKAAMIRTRPGFKGQKGGEWGFVFRKHVRLKSVRKRVGVESFLHKKPV